MGLAGFYRQFVPKFVDLTSRLIDLTCNSAPDLVQWTGQCQAAFVRVKEALCGEPLLYTPVIQHHRKGVSGDPAGS